MRGGKYDEESDFHWWWWNTSFFDKVGFFFGVGMIIGFLYIVYKSFGG